MYSIGTTVRKQTFSFLFLSLTQSPSFLPFFKFLQKYNFNLLYNHRPNATLTIIHMSLVEFFNIIKNLVDAFQHFYFTSTVQFVFFFKAVVLLRYPFVLAVTSQHVGVFVYVCMFYYLGNIVGWFPDMVYVLIKVLMKVEGVFSGQGRLIQHASKNSYPSWPL